MTPFSVSHSQLDTDISKLSGLVDGIADQRSEEPLLPDDEIEDTQSDFMKMKKLQEFQEKNFGFQSRNGFEDDSRSKIFEQPLTYFGYSFFVDAPTTFAPVKNVPIPPEYILGPGDNIKISLFGTKNRQFTLQVSREGDIFFPEIGAISIAGLTFPEMKKTINEIVSNKIIGTSVNVTLGALRTINIFVLGDAYQPGVYTVSALSTLTNAIFVSGGINPTGSLRSIELKRNGSVISTFDLYDLLLNGDNSKDMRLMSGDVIFIKPKDKIVAISGEVSRPGIYELTADETLEDLIGYAGNLKAKADVSSIDLQRIDRQLNSYKLSSLNLNVKEEADYILNKGDLLAVYPIRNTLNNAVLFKGHALNPGFYSLSKDMRIGDIIRSKDDLLTLTDLNYVLIKRENKLTQDFEFLQVDLEKVFQDPSSEVNINLIEKDEVIFFPALLRPDQIQTTLIQDEYTLENNQLVLENEWTSLTYLRKSLMEEIKKSDDTTLNPSNTLNNEKVNSRYYEYTIFDYCVVPRDLAIRVIESSGFRANKTIAIDELQTFDSPEDFIGLKQEIESERLETIEASKASDIEMIITQLCREQILNPIRQLSARELDQSQKSSTVSIYGNVYFPGVYPLTNSMNISDVIKSAGGLKEATYNSQIELSRSNISGKDYTVRNSFSSIADSIENLNQVEAMDVITVKQISNEIQTVEITGEVYFPGVYPISDNQTINDLIIRAGGLKSSADPKAAYFQREALKEAELERLQGAQDELRRKIVLSSSAGGLGQNALNSDSILQLTQLISQDTSNSRSKLGRLVIDLEAIISSGVEDIALQDGDILNIPKASQTISVIGEVYVPNSHVYNNTNNVQDYIKLSGGYNMFADNKSVYIIKSNGSIISPSELTGNGFFRGNNSRLETGDTIVVPLQVTPFSSIKATTEITQIIYQMALAAAAVNSF